MTPVTRCLRKVDHASAVTDTTVVENVLQALNELEAAYYRPSDKIIALEAVLQGVVRHRSDTITPFERFVQGAVEQRQEQLARLSS